jgi:hypothetical protein
MRPVTTILLRAGRRKTRAFLENRRRYKGGQHNWADFPGEPAYRRKLLLFVWFRRSSLARMQTLRSAVVRLLMWTPVFFLFSPVVNFATAAPPKVHTVTLGAVRKVPYTLPVSSAGKMPDPAVLKVRPLMLDGRQKEWTTGDAHDVTDRSFTIQRALRLNDSLPGDTAAHWSWQPGPWLLVDRTTGHIAALHLPNFDAVVSEAVWYRDYAAYCGTAQTAKGGLFAMVAQIGTAKTVVKKLIGKWPQAAPVQPVCKTAEWQRSPIRVTMQATGGEPMTFDVVGAAALIEEGDADDTP